MKRDVEGFVQECDIYERCKTKSGYTWLLQPLPVSDQAWQHIAMNFIEGLPKSMGSYVILVVIDCSQSTLTLSLSLHTTLLKGLLTLFLSMSSSCMDYQNSLYQIGKKFLLVRFDKSYSNRWVPNSKCP